MNYTFLQIGLILKLINKTELILFSEEEYIKTKKNIYLDIISLSETSDLNKFIEILDQNSSQVTKDEFDKVNSLFLFFILKEDNWKKIQSKLLSYYVYFKTYLDDNDYEFWSRLNDDFQLREEGFPGCMRMPSEMLTYFAKINTEKIQGSFLKNLVFRI